MIHKVFDQSQVMIEGHFVKVENHSIYISHIAFFWAGRIPRKPLPYPIFYFFILLTLFGIRFFDLMIMLQVTVLCLVISGAIYIVPKRPVGINIKLISGEIVSFIPKNEGFTYKVYDLLHDILNSDKVASKYKIDFRGDGEIINNYENQKISNYAVTINEVTENEIVYNKNKVYDNVKNTDEIEVYEEYEKKNNEVIYNANGNIVQELDKLYSFYDSKEDKKEQLLELIRQAILLNKENNKENKKEMYERFIQSGLINECNEIGLNFLLDDIKNIVY